MSDELKQAVFHSSLITHHSSLHLWRMVATPRAACQAAHSGGKMERRGGGGGTPPPPPPPPRRGGGFFLHRGPGGGARGARFASFPAAVRRRGGVGARRAWRER